MTVATLEQKVAADQSWRDRVESARCLLSAFDLLGVPETMLDMGCGWGHLVAIADALGVLARGVDINASGKGYPEGSVVLWGDLTDSDPEPHWLPYEKQDLVLCLEVAEHLPESAADTLCDTLAATTGGCLLFSAATPGQGGSGHLNEQLPDYWRRRLEARGLTFHRALTETLRRRWEQDAPGAWWYGRNLQVFTGRAS